MTQGRKETVNPLPARRQKFNEGRQAVKGRRHENSESGRETCVGTAVGFLRPVAAPCEGDAVKAPFVVGRRKKNGEFRGGNREQRKGVGEAVRGKRDAQLFAGRHGGKIVVSRQENFVLRKSRRPDGNRFFTIMQNRRHPHGHPGEGFGLHFFNGDGSRRKENEQVVADPARVDRERQIFGGRGRDDARHADHEPCDV